MRFQLLTFAICIVMIFLCSKKDRPEKAVSHYSDSITMTPPEKDHTPVEETEELAKTETYRLITGSQDTPGKINADDIAKLTEPLKAIAALYSGLGGSGCEEDSCGLTAALGLGKQGSQAQKNLVRKWFRKDAAAEQLIKQDFYQAPNSSSDFSDFRSLAFRQKGDTVTVDYNLMTYSHGETGYIMGPDRFVIKGNTIKTLHRNIWKDVR
ncbi:hypothetical protein CHA01nite_24870 [Chryseobacterium hagamense]|uniref:Uncharacterized protein n=2 Tax=Chryseobacterium hagamense TaxID=395935 RepID=A0A511YNH6_9FLAO|nr:hypothetical protein CHA01nite_24870 [Chryseobacterium hagamense]